MEYDALRGAQWPQAFPQNSRTNPLRPPLPLIPNLKKEKNISQGDYDFYVTHYVDRPSYDGLRRKVFDTIRSANKPTLVFECPVFRQNLKKPWTSFRFGWNHYLANGEFNNRQVGNDKIEKIIKEQNLTIARKTIHKPNGNILILLPSTRGASSNNMYKTYGYRSSWWDDLEKNDPERDIALSTHPPLYNDYHSRWCLVNWLRDVIKQIREVSNLPIIIRRHPGSNSNNADLDKPLLKIAKQYPGVNLKGGSKVLSVELSNASFVVGWATGALIESVMRGIPTITLSEEAHTYEVSKTTIHSGITEEHTRNYEKIFQWLSRLAYTQWTKEEITDGRAWEHLKHGYEFIPKSYLDVNKHYRSCKF